MKHHFCPVGVPLLFWFALLSVVRAAPSGLVHHWNFDEGPDWHDSAFRAVSVAATAFDSVGGADAALRNMGGTNWVSGRQFTALEFDGANQFLEVGTNLAATLGGTASLSFWIRTVQTGAETSSASPGVAGVLGAGGLQWGWLDDSGRIALSVGGLLAVRSAAAINNGQWHHTVFTRDAATVQQLWDNHAPKTWDSTTVGTAPGFTTESMLFRAYDPDQDPVSLFSHGNPTHGSVVYRGDYFTFVMGHEVTHSLDGYVNGRANKDLRRRWGLVLCTAAGPDIIPGANGWIDWSATKANFQAKGFWDGASTNWSFAWSNYWATGPGPA